MNNIAYGLIALVFIAAHHIWLIRYSRAHVDDWMERKIHAGHLGFDKALTITTLISVSAGVFAFLIRWLHSSSPLLDAVLIPYAVAAVVWISVFSALTDIASLKVPMDVAVRGYWAVAPTAVISLFLVQDWLFTLISILLFLGWAMFLYFFFGRGFGQADVRLLLLYAYGLVWWVGIDWVFYSFLIACVAQLVLFHPLASVLRIGKVRVPGQRYNPNIDVMPPSADIYAGEAEFGKVPHKRGFIPLVPSLTITYITCIVISLLVDRTACSAYDGTFCAF